MNKEKRKENVLKCLCSIPQQIIQLHGVDNMTEFLLHHLSAPDCFNLCKAALFIDNPDFNHLKGVAGIESKAAYQDGNHWENPKDFTNHMLKKEFNNKVRSIAQDSFHHHEQPKHETIIHSLADELSLNNHSHFSWPLKYNNHGIIIFELQEEEERPIIEEFIGQAAHLFGFCPVF